MVGEETEDILVYTGFLLEDIKREDTRRCLLDKIAVLIDGPYVEAKNKGHVLKGSENQTIYYIKEQLRPRYESYIEKHRGKYLAENFPAKDGVISVGIHKPDFRDELKRKVGRKNEC